MSFEQSDIQWYANAAKRYPLLTPLQEIELSRQIHAAARLADVKDPTPAQRRVLKVGAKAREKMVHCNMRLVITVAMKYANALHGGAGMSMADLVQEGIVGLMTAIERFEGTRGYKFTTFAYWWIRQAVGRAISNQKRTIRLPVHVVDRIGKLNQAHQMLRDKHGRSPTIAELGESLGFSEDRMMELMVQVQPTHSLNLMIDESGHELLDLITAEDDDSGWIDNVGLIRSEMNGAMQILDDRERAFVQAYYGITSDPMSLVAIGAQHGVSRERVRQVINRALNKLRRRLTHSQSHQLIAAA
jgi:RNA polymerase sigma factor (sigma-70 family)